MGVLLERTTKVVGTSHRPEGIPKLIRLAQRSPDRYPRCSLRREPDNPHDTYAIKVLVGGTHVGYIGVEHNQDLAEYMDRGCIVTTKINDVTVWPDYPSSPTMVIDITVTDTGADP